MDSKDLSGVKHVRLDMTARDKGKGGPDKGHTTKFSPSKVVHYFPNFRSYFGMEYEQPWNMGKILLETWFQTFSPPGLGWSQRDRSPWNYRSGADGMMGW